MTTLFDLLRHPPGRSPYDLENSNLTERQQIKLHHARSLCGLLLEVADVSADFPVSHPISMSALGGTLWLLRNLIDEAGTPDLTTEGEQA